MTTVNTFQGYTQDRSTSRVLAPPGGRSNFSFSDGSQPEPAPTRAGSAACQSARNKSSVFDAAPAEPKAAAPSRQVMAAPVPEADKPRTGYRSSQPPGGRSSNIIFG